MQLVVSALVGWTHVNAQGQRCETKADCTGKKTLGCSVQVSFCLTCPLPRWVQPQLQQVGLLCEPSRFWQRWAGNIKGKRRFVMPWIFGPGISRKLLCGLVIWRVKWELIKYCHININIETNINIDHNHYINIIITSNSIGLAAISANQVISSHQSGSYSSNIPLKFY